MHHNKLSQETSPYLLQHQHNPVEWFAWNDEAFEIAKMQNKPILLSVGYSACHWCHVMAHESFENADIAKIMNEKFINIKVDREERPDIDLYYQQALQALGRHGGWPLTMFLTSDGKPFWGGTYFPAEERHNLPAFPTLLKKIAQTYQTNITDLKESSEQINQYILSEYQDNLKSSHQNLSRLSLKKLDDMAQHILKYLDPIHGGLQGSPKFPQPNVIQFLWRTYQRTKDASFKDAVILWLEKMSNGGIYDHIGGGYSRYSTDHIWLVPHFEKMLYDNAQILDVLASVWSETHYPLFQQRIEETIAWLHRDMTLDGGGFASALDADSEGQEGKFYVWSTYEIDELLEKDSFYFKKTYGVVPEGNWEGKNILNRLDSSSTPKDESDLEVLKFKLLQARSLRPHPLRDNKVLTDWNGLMISALVQASVICNRMDWLELAQKAFNFLIINVTENNAQFIKHSWCQNQKNKISFLEDYGAMIRATINLFQVTGQKKYLEYAESWATTVQHHYLSETGIYFKRSNNDEEKILPRLTETQETVVPSGNALIFEAWIKLGLITEKDLYIENAEKMLKFFEENLENSPLSQVTILNAYDLWQRGIKINMYMLPEDPLHKLFLNFLYTKISTTLLINYPSDHLRKKKNNSPYVIVCKDFACSAPIYTLEELKKSLIN